MPCAAELVAPLLMSVTDAWASSFEAIGELVAV